MGALDEYMKEEDKKKADSCGLVRMSQIEAHDPEFLWWPYLRLGNLNLLRGNGGSGKTSLTFALAAAISKGVQPAEMPGQLNVDRPGIVIYLGSEDDLPEYRAMLDRNGADPNNILIPSAHIPTLGEMSTIEMMIRRFAATMIVVDPVQALLPDGVDMNKSNQVRPLLDDMRRVCRETGCTALILEHLNKMTKSANAYRGSGSMDFYNASRSVLIAGWTPDGQRVCGHLKSNGANFGPGILFDIDKNGRLAWGGGDSTIGGEDVETTKPRAKITAPNPYGFLTQKLIEKDGHWKGTPAQAISLASELGVNGVVSPEGFGKFLKQDLTQFGARATKQRAGRGTIYSLEAYKHGEGDDS